MIIYSSFFTMLAETLKRIDNSAMVYDVPEKYRKTPEELYYSRRVSEQRFAENADIHYKNIKRL